MQCLICQAASKIVHIAGCWSEIKCSAGCGHFRVSANLVAKMKFKNEFFDVERTTQWLEMARREGPMPLISTYDYNVSLLHRATKERSDSLPSRSRKSMTLE
jgi:hypothetical protein